MENNDKSDNYNLLSSSSDFNIKRDSSSRYLNNKLERFTIAEENEDEIVSQARKHITYATLIFCVITLTMKIYTSIYPSTTNMNFTFFRWSGMTATAYAYMTYHQKDIANIKNLGSNVLWMILRILILICGIPLILISLLNLKLGVFTVILMMMPIFQNILATFILKEPFQTKYLYACFLLVAGVVIMTYDKFGLDEGIDVEALEADVPTHTPNFVLGFFAGLANALAISILNISMKILGKEFDSFNLNYFSAFWASIGALAYCLIFQDFSINSYFFSPGVIILGLINGALTFASYVNLYFAFTLCDMAKTSYIMYLQLPISCIIGFIFYGEYLTIDEFIGGAIIIITLIYVSVFMK